MNMRNAPDVSPAGPPAGVAVRSNLGYATDAMIELLSAMQVNDTSTQRQPGREKPAASRGGPVGQFTLPSPISTLGVT